MKKMKKQQQIILIFDIFKHKVKEIEENKMY